MSSPALLSVSGLTIQYGTRTVVDGVAFDVYAGKVVAVVGQSGSGKSTIARAVQGLLPEGGRVSAGDIRIDGRSVAGLTQRQWRDLRGADVGFVPLSLIHI